MPIRCAVDARLATETKRAGVGRYAIEVLRALPHVAPDIECVAYTNVAPPCSFPFERCVVLPDSRAWLQTRLAPALRRARPDVLWSPAMQGPLFAPCKTVATVHDLAAFRFAQTFSFRKRVRQQMAAHLCAWSAARLVCDSHATAHDVRRFLRVAEHRIDVAHLGVDLAFFRRAAPALIDATRAKHALANPFVLYVGRIQPRKNLVRLIEAFSAWAARHPDKPHELVFAGDAGWLTSDSHAAALASPVSDRIRFLGYVDDADLPALYSTADLVVLVSLWEGFGLPVLEALACESVVLASDVSSLPEAAGDAALLANPESVEAIRNGIESGLADDRLRTQLMVRARAHAERFTWSETAQQVAAALRRAAAQ